MKWPPGKRKTGVLGGRLRILRKILVSQSICEHVDSRSHVKQSDCSFASGCKPLRRSLAAIRCANNGGAIACSGETTAFRQESHAIGFQRYFCTAEKCFCFSKQIADFLKLPDCFGKNAICYAIARLKGTSITRLLCNKRRLALYSIGSISTFLQPPAQACRSCYVVAIVVARSLAGRSLGCFMLFADFYGKIAICYAKSRLKGTSIKGLLCSKQRLALYSIGSISTCLQSPARACRSCYALAIVVAKLLAGCSPGCFMLFADCYGKIAICYAKSRLKGTSIKGLLCSKQRLALYSIGSISTCLQSPAQACRSCYALAIVVARLLAGCLPGCGLFSDCCVTRPGVQRAGESRQGVLV